MKKIVISGIAAGLFFMFLIYSGVFRNNSNPLEVADYYFECLKSQQGFLTYQISMPDCFDTDQQGVLYKKYNMGDIRKLKLKLAKIKDDGAYVYATFVYKNKDTVNNLVKLQKVDNAWLVKEVLYNYRI